ncbi:hypothetical protein DRQ05_00570 [bacterium]|nr:MAG: hypothetical protein DRQ05_00570 [bacterium]
MIVSHEISPFTLFILMVLKSSGNLYSKTIQLFQSTDMIRQNDKSILANKMCRLNIENMIVQR